MTTDNEYSDMGICPKCLSEGFDGVCDRCGHIETSPRRDYCDIDYNYLKHSEDD